MISFTLSLLSLVVLSVAQNQTASLFFGPDVDNQSLVGSIVGGDATATTYVVQCANGGSNGAAAMTTASATAAATTAGAAATTDFSDDGGDLCGFPTPVTIVEGPSTVAWSLGFDGSTVSLDCVLSGTSVAVCNAAATGDLLGEQSLPPVTSATLSGTDVSYLLVVITAGSVTNTASSHTSTTASTTGVANGGSSTGTAKEGSTGGTQTQTGSTTSASTKASGAAIHIGPAMGLGAAGALAAVAAVVL